MNYIFENYKTVADLIAATFGSRCEVVIHDFSKPQNSIVYILNSEVSGRKIGDSFTQAFIKSVLLSEGFQEDLSANYSFEVEGDKEIKASTALIRDEERKVIGALCVNVDTTKANSLIAEFLNTVGIASDLQPETQLIEETSHIKEIVDNIINDTISDAPVKDLTREERVNIVSFMDSKGLFLIKGAADKVADELELSKVTIYSYLDEIRKDKE